MYCLYVSIAYVSIHVYLCICAFVYVYVCSVYVCMYVSMYQSYMSLWDLLDWIRVCDHQVVQQWLSHNGKAENWIVVPP